MKHVRLTLNLTDLGVSPCSTMFFVYVTAKGDPSPDTPSELIQTQILGTVIDFRPIYNQALKFIKEINNECEIPKKFIDMILRFKAVELCIRTANYPLAIKYWK